ncbi:hypothetical protein TNCV_1718841 [Trichonephila clavipes]|nr:hypothetical protein TNCV_1718841 [Trichonephila clavipes]
MQDANESRLVTSIRWVVEAVNDQLKKVVGCCEHVASVLWYLGYWLHNHTQTKTPSLGYADILQDAANGWSSDDSASESQKEI